MPVQRGEIYLVDLNPVRGREQAGSRPVLVISTDAINRLPLVVTIVVGTKGENVTRDYPTNRPGCEADLTNDPRLRSGERAGAGTARPDGSSP